MTEDYLQAYRSRVYRTGSTPQRKIEYNSRKDFERFLKYSPTQEVITLENGRSIIVSLQTEKQDYFTTNKTVLAKLDSPVGEGSLFDWNTKNSKWLVISEISDAREHYKKLIARECEYMLRWRSREDNSILEFPVAIFKPMSQQSMGGAKEVLRQGLVFDVPIGSILVAMPKKYPMDLIRKDHRFIIEDMVWEAKVIDYISSKNLIFMLLEHTMLDPRRDDIVDEISNIDFNETSVIVDIGDFVYAIEGTGSLIWGEEYTYTISKRDSSGNLVGSNFFCAISDLSLLTTESSTTNTVTVIAATGTIGTARIDVHEGSAGGPLVLQKYVSVKSFM